MRQILYMSLARDAVTSADVEQILQRSRHNNSLDGIKGILWSNGHKFVEVMEGPRSVISQTFARMQRDQRHHSITVLSDRITDKPEFVSWTMVYRPSDGVNSDDAQIKNALNHTSDEVRAQFLGAISNVVSIKLKPPMQADLTPT